MEQIIKHTLQPEKVKIQSLDDVIQVSTLLLYCAELYCTRVVPPKSPAEFSHIRYKIELIDPTLTAADCLHQLGRAESCAFHEKVTALTFLYLSLQCKSIYHVRCTVKGRDFLKTYR